MGTWFPHAPTQTAHGRHFYYAHPGPHHNRGTIRHGGRRVPDSYSSHGDSSSAMAAVIRAAKYRSSVDAPRRSLITAHCSRRRRGNKLLPEAFPLRGLRSALTPSVGTRRFRRRSSAGLRHDHQSCLSPDARLGPTPATPSSCCGMVGDAGWTRDCGRESRERLVRQGTVGGLMNQLERRPSRRRRLLRRSVETKL